jgi:hypothetical protein
MRIIGCDLHARQQTIAMLDSDTGELQDKTTGSVRIAHRLGVVHQPSLRSPATMMISSNSLLFCGGR